MRFAKALAACAAAFVMLAGGQAAQAGIPIPCTGQKIVLVQPIEVPEESRPQHGGLGLGYLFNGCFSGRWVTHVGSSSQYKEGGDAMLALAAAGSGKVPSEPGLFGAMLSHPGSFWVEWLWLVIGMFIAVGSALSAFAQKAGASLAAQPQFAGAQLADGMAGGGLPAPVPRTPRSPAVARGGRTRSGGFGRR